MIYNIQAANFSRSFAEDTCAEQNGAVHTDIACRGKRNRGTIRLDRPREVKAVAAANCGRSISIRVIDDGAILRTVEPKSQADIAKMDNGLAKLAEEDPTFTVRTDEQSGQTIISGMGELHLDIIIDRLKREFKVECNQGKPQVNYKEAITKTAQSRETYKKQSGGRGKFACIDVTIGPKDEDYKEGDLQFINEVKGGNVPMHGKFEKFNRFMKKLCLLTVLMAVLTIVCFTSVGCTDKKPAPAIDSASSDTVIADTQAMDSTEQLIEETPMPKAADELFDDFVFNFAANRKLQKSRIVFPLPVYHGKKLTKKIEKKHWKMEHFFMRQDYYTLIFDNQKQMKLMKDTTIDHVVIEKVFYSRKTVQQFVFNRINGQWMMTSICYVPMYQNNNASFLKFYGHFATDTAFQARHIHNPVKFTGPDPDDDFSTMTGDIEPETWPAFAPQLPHGMIYNVIYGQKYTESNQKIFVIRGIANGMETSLTFKKIGGKWELIKLNM